MKKRENGFGIIPAEVYEKFKSKGMTPRAQALCAGLGKYMGGADSCYPSDAELGKLLGWPVYQDKLTGREKCRSVSAAKRVAVKAGVIIIQRHGQSRASIKWANSQPAANQEGAQVATGCESETVQFARLRTPKSQRAATELEEEQTTTKKKPCRSTTPTNPEVKLFIEWWSERYEAEFAKKYIVAGGKEGRLVKGLLKQVGVEKLKDAAEVMLADKWGRKNASIAILASQINTWLRGNHGQTGKQKAAPGKYDKVGTVAKA